MKRRSKEVLAEIASAKEIAISLSDPDKMPCSSYSIPASRCKVGSILRNVQGTVCENCFAFERGNYRFRNVQACLEKRFQSLGNPEWVNAMETLIRHDNKGDTNYFRWHDSGDIQSEEHLANICEIARRLPQIKFWLPTKEWKVCRDYFASNPMPENLNVRLSIPRKNQDAPQEAEASDQFTYSEVFTDTGKASNAAYVCPAYHQGRKCLDCRKCWDKENLITAYPEH